MAYAFYDSTLGMVGPADADFAGPGPGPNAQGVTFGRMNFYNQEMHAYDPTLGAATLKYLRYSGTIAAATVCEMTPSIVGTALVDSATAWVGTANSGRTVVVALFPGIVSQYGWFIVQGFAVVTSQGAPVAGNPAYWQAAGVVSPTAVAGKQLLGAMFAVAPSTTIGSGNTAVVLSATQAIITLNRPIAQGQIT